MSALLVDEPKLSGRCQLLRQCGASLLYSLSPGDGREDQENEHQGDVRGLHTGGAQEDGPNLPPCPPVLISVCTSVCYSCPVTDIYIV